MTSVRLEQIIRRYGATVALGGIDLTIERGELFFLLGPSGCGKSTLLRIIAGLDAPTSGRVWFDERDVTRLATEKRNAVMCFQSYALWPHLSARDNVAFGLDVRGVSRAEQNRRVDEMLQLVRLGEQAERKPNQLSGGQQQRVALARALAVHPDCLLLDEPLSNLDASLRQEMRVEIRRICKGAGLTTVYVTHDQKEALSVADRIAVMHRGLVAQVGRPAELYRRPQNSFVAEFIGDTNLLPATIISRDNGTLSLETPIGKVLAEGKGDLPAKVVLSLRPELIKVSRGEGSSEMLGGVAINRASARSIETVFLGESSEHVFAVNAGKLSVLSAPPILDLPESVTLEFAARDVVVLKE